MNLARPLLVLAWVICQAPIFAGELVSVIIPAYNASSYINRAIESVRAQTHQEWELLVVDDASTDDTARIVQSLAAQDSRIQYIRAPTNLGVGGARNLGLRQARSSLVAFLDADDFWFANKLEAQIAFLRSSDAPFSYSSFVALLPNGQFSVPIPVPATATYPQLLRSNFVPMLTVMIDLKKTGPIQFQSGYNEDFRMWLQLTREGHIGQAVPGVFAVVEKRGNSVSSSKLKAAREFWRVLNDQDQIGLGRRLLYFSIYASNGLRRYQRYATPASDCRSALTDSKPELPPEQRISTL